MRKIVLFSFVVLSFPLMFPEAAHSQSLYVRPNSSETPKSEAEEAQRRSFYVRPPAERRKKPQVVRGNEELRLDLRALNQEALLSRQGLRESIKAVYNELKYVDPRLLAAGGRRATSTAELRQVYAYANQGQVINDVKAQQKNIEKNLKLKAKALVGPQQDVKTQQFKKNAARLRQDEETQMEGYPYKYTLPKRVFDILR